MHRSAQLAFAAMVMAGCAVTSPQSAIVVPPSVATHAAFATALRAGRVIEARALIAGELRSQPDNGYLHLLNALTYELADDSTQNMDLAAVGYDSAVRLAPGFYWAHYFDGALAVKRHDYAASENQFATAIASDPSRVEAFVGLAVAAYASGDIEVASRAANRALALSPADPVVLRAAAYIAAAESDRAGVQRLQSAARLIPSAAAELLDSAPRLAQIMRTAAIDAATSSEMQPAGANAAVAARAPDPRQLMVEVTLLLSQNAETNRTGINLLDGLSLQFGGRRDDRRDAPGVGDARASHVLTEALSIPEINYSLNLFNTKDDYYEVIARPSLVASLGQQSDFFIGRTVIVGVSGINLGTLQPVDVGTSVKVMPIEITATSAKIRVDAARSFFAQETGGTFAQSLTTFKQSVGATVEVAFGTTLILSGLYESVNVGGNSKVPGLGDVPGVDTLFNARNHTSRHDAALVLVTPRIPGVIATGSAQFRGVTLKRVLNLWNQLVVPSGDLDATLHILELKAKYFTPLAGDMKLPDARQGSMLAEVVTDTLARLR